MKSSGRHIKEASGQISERRISSACTTQGTCWKSLMGILLQATLLPLLYSCDLKQSSSRSSVCGICLKNANSPLQKCITSSYVQKQFNQTIQHVTFVSWAFNFTSALMYLRNDSEIIPEIWQVIHRSSFLLMNPLPI